MPVIFFLHGLESGPDGLKIQAMRRVAERLGWHTNAPDFRGMRDPALRASYLRELLPHNQFVLLVGSSLGGYVAASVASSPGLVQGLFLLCPAFDLPQYPLTRPKQPLRGNAVRIVHGRHDSVVPLTNSERAASEWQCPLLVTDDEHPLHASVDLICAWFEDWLRQQHAN